MKKHLITFLVFLVQFGFAQTHNTIVVKKKAPAVSMAATSSATVPNRGLSIKDLYPNLEGILPLKIISFRAFQIEPNMDPRGYTSDSEFINFYMKECKGCYVYFDEIRVERPDGNLAMLDFFYCHSFSKRAKASVTKSLRSWYPDPNVQKFAAEFVSYDLTITTLEDDRQLVSRRQVLDDRFLVGHLPYERLTYKFSNITIKTKSGIMINVDPFVREVGMLVVD